MDSTDLLHPFNPLNPNLFDPRNMNPTAPMMNPAHPLAPLYHDDKDARKYNDEGARNIRKMENTTDRGTTNFKVYIGNKEVTNLLSIGAMIGGTLLVVIFASRLKNQANRKRGQDPKHYWAGVDYGPIQPYTKLEDVSKALISVDYGPIQPYTKHQKRKNHHEKTKGKNKGSVVYEEDMSLEVANWLMQKGFYLDTVNEGYISIVASDSDVAPKRQLDRILARDAWVYLGYINFAADSKGKPVLDFTFHGRKYADMVRRLAEEMTSEFNAKIILHLDKEEPKLKTYAPPY